MGWQGRLQLHYRHEGGHTLAHDRHHGPLRVLQRLYPEGPGICHHVLVHPPGGLVGGDDLLLEAELGPHSHALITTPGATRFYRSLGDEARQCVQVRAAAGSRLEWLPLETLAYSGCLGCNQLSFTLDDGAEMIGWDVLALGLPAAGAAFERGAFTQALELPGVWLERGRIAADDKLLLDSPLGLAGHRVLGTMWFAAGAPLAAARRDMLLDAARECAGGHALARSAGCTSTHEQAVVLRVLAPRVEPAMQLLAAVWRRWRGLAWGLAPNAPRVWRT
jgi:urease accessory protein